MPKTVVHRPSKRRRLLLVAVGVAVFVALVVLVTNADRDEVPLSPDSQPPVEEEALLHVHGLGVDPADATLYVATHSGLFRVVGTGDASPVGRHRYDLMGFTVVGPGRFIASGHPDVAGIRQTLPGQLGVMASADAGGTWDQIALAGEADLHALTYADGRAYGVDVVSGRLLVSDDLRTWTSRGELPASSLAGDPGDRDNVVAATEDGLRRSVDGGVTWESLPGPALRLLGWDRRSGLWGVADDGSVHRRDSATSEWIPLPRLSGDPQAAISRDGVRYVAVHDEARTVIYQSEGDEWRAIFDGS